MKKNLNTTTTKKQFKPKNKKQKFKKDSDEESSQMDDMELAELEKQANENFEEMKNTKTKFIQKTIDSRPKKQKDSDSESEAEKESENLNPPNEEGEENFEDEIGDDAKDLKSQKKYDVATLNIDMTEVNLKIQNIVDILSDFKNKRSKEMSRSDYMAELKKLSMVYYDYNEDITNLILYLFPPNEAI